MDSRLEINEVKPKKEDRRIQRTRHALRDALIEEIVEKGYENTTLQDIADRANVSRSTFYLHYKDKEELLFRGMEEVWQELLESYQIVSRDDLQSGKIPDSYFSPADFEHVAKHAEFYKAILSNRGSAAFIAQVCQFLAIVMSEKTFKPLIAEGQTPRIPPDFVANFLAGAEVGVVRWWLENGMHYTPKQMSVMFCYTAGFGTWWAAGLEVEAPDKVGLFE